MSEWSDAELAILVELARDGQSSSTIGKALGRSRNAIIGKCRRKGIPLDFNRNHVPRTSERRRAWQANYMRRKRESRTAKPYTPKASPTPPTPTPQQPPPRPEPVVVRNTKPVLFLKRRMSDGLGNGQCCAILNDGAPIEELMVCGGPILEGSQFEFCPQCQLQFLQPARRPPSEYVARAA